jgi:hypothetical protein
VASVGSDRVIQLPKKSIVLPGSGTDPDGTIVSYLWTQLSGPSEATMVDVTSAQAVAGDMVAGDYQFQLTVTDDQGATGSKVLYVTVNSMTTSYRMSNQQSDSEMAVTSGTENSRPAIGADSSLQLHSSINLLDELNVRLTAYPNPTNNFTNLQLTGLNTAQQIDIVITNLSGEQVYKETAFVQGNMTKKIDLSRLNSGTYIISVFYNGKNIKSTKVLKL